MTEDLRVEVHGQAELERGTDKLADRIGDAAPRRFREVADAKARTVRGRVPRKSGALAGSVTSKLLDDGAAVTMGGADVPYAGWIEFGGTRGRPYIDSGRYLYPTAMDAEPQLVAAGEDLADDEIGRFRWETPNT